MSKIICVKCECEFRPEQNRVGVIETASFGPYKLWRADLWKCPSCGIEVVSGFGRKPVAEHFEESFGTELENLKSTTRIVYDNERPYQGDTRPSTPR